MPGKFDALHVGHRALAEAASSQGAPTLLSFSGMAALLRWPPRHPVVAASERKRILADWSVRLPQPVSQRVLPFSEIQGLSGERFLRMLRDEFAAEGIVCGKDWRFGHGASCGVEELHDIAGVLGLSVTIVPPVMVEGDIASSTRVREALNRGEVDLVERLLGRVHRVVGIVETVGEDIVTAGSFVNTVPADGWYSAMVRVLGRTEPYRTKVEVKRMDGEAFVLLHESETVYCAECEIYVDFYERLS